MPCFQDDERYEQASDVRAQLKFFEQLDQIEKQRKDEQEREILMRAAKASAWISHTFANCLPFFFLRQKCSISSLCKGHPVKGKTDFQRWNMMRAVSVGTALFCFPQKGQLLCLSHCISPNSVGPPSQSLCFSLWKKVNFIAWLYS